MVERQPHLNLRDGGRGRHLDLVLCIWSVGLWLRLLGGCGLVVCRLAFDQLPLFGRLFVANLDIKRVFLKRIGNG